jgi:hypothetical protein
MTSMTAPVTTARAGITHREMTQMQQVIDSNFLQSEKLRDYLAASPSNQAVITDYAAMEAHKGDTLKSIYKSMGILCEFPKQVVILKSTMVVCGLRGRGPDLREPLIDRDQTNGFPAYCRQLRAAQEGDVALQHDILEHGRVATAQMARVQADVAIMPEVFAGRATVFTKDEISILRHGTPLTETMLDKLMRSTMMLAANFFKTHPNGGWLPTAKELPNTFIFRFSLCAYLLHLNWIAQGSQAVIKPEKLRNDMVDVNFAAFATYFDGLLSADKKLTGIYVQANYILRQIISWYRDGN